MLYEITKHKNQIKKICARVYTMITVFIARNLNHVPMLLFVSIVKMKWACVRDSSLVMCNHVGVVWCEFIMAL
jgi:hypothetical protein